MPAPTGESDAAAGRESFIQPLTAVIRNQGRLTPAELNVFLDLQTYDWDGSGAWVGQKTIAADLGISERTVRSAVKKLDLVGAIERQRRRGRTNLCKVKRGWVPGDPGNECRGATAGSVMATPARIAGDPGNDCRTPRQNMPDSAAQSAAEIEPRNNNHEPEAVKTEHVSPPSAAVKPLSNTTVEVIQEPTQEGSQEPLAKRAQPAEVRSWETTTTTSGSIQGSLTDSVADIDYHSPRLNADEEILVVELATRFNEIQTIIGRKAAVGARWEKSLIGFRMLLFSEKHGRSGEDVRLVLDYLTNNPSRAKEIVNKDKQRGVTNTYHLMFLFDRLHQEALGCASGSEKTFSTRKIRLPNSVASA